MKPIKTKDGSWFILAPGMWIQARKIGGSIIYSLVHAEKGAGK